MLEAVLSSANNAWKRRNSHIIIKYTSLIMKHLAYVRDPLRNKLVCALVNSIEFRKLFLAVNTFK